MWKLLHDTVLPKKKWHDVCTRNAEMCDAGVLIFFLFVMCSFSCWLVIQSRVSLPPVPCYDLCRVCESNTCSRYFVLQHSGQLENSSCWFIIVLCFRSQPKEAVSPRHVYRVRWHVCGWLWCKYFNIKLGRAPCIFLVIVNTIVPLTSFLDCFCRVPEWEQQV